VLPQQNDLSVNALVFDTLAFMRQNAKVFRKYMFLPLVFSIASLFLVQIPYAGLALSSVSNSLALALVGVSATRFYIYGTTDAVADGANRAFARFFFFTFVITLLAHGAEIFQLLPEAMQGMVLMWMMVTFWINLRLCLAFPALAMEHPGSLWDVVRTSYGWSEGHLLKIIGSFIICYCPMIFFTFMMMQVTGLSVLKEDADFWTNLAPLIFSDVLIIFGMMWSSLVLAKIYKTIVLNNRT